MNSVVKFVRDKFNIPFTHFVYCDGGRKEAGFKAVNVGDCVCRAIAIATELPYKQVYDDLNRLAKIAYVKRRTKRKGNSPATSRNGMDADVAKQYMLSLGWKWVPTMKIGSGCKVHLRSDELPSGRIVVTVSKHWTAMIDGVIHDTYDPSREGTRCVYGYFIKE